jgi:hypothetical protein
MAGALKESTMKSYHMRVFLIFIPLTYSAESVLASQTGCETEGTQTCCYNYNTSQTCCDDPFNDIYFCIGTDNDISLFPAPERTRTAILKPCDGKRCQSLPIFVLAMCPQGFRSV